MKRLAVVIFCSCVVSAFAAWSAADVKEEFHKTYPISPRGTVSLENVNGDATIAVWDRSEVKVDAIKEGEDNEALRLTEIIVEASADRVSVRTEYPEHMKRHEHGATVTYTITVPRAVRLEDVRLVNGSLNIEGVRGEINASIVNGALKAIGVAADAKLSTVNGRLEARVEEGVDHLSMESVNGTLAVTLPASIDARISASTLNGSIDDQFDLGRVRKHLVGRSLDATIGNGDTDIELSTVNGSIDINRY